MQNEKTLEEQITELQEKIELLMQGRAISPAKRLQNIRKECREKYFGTWKEVLHKEMQYGPDGKAHPDYALVQDIIHKTTGLFFKYSRGRSCAGTNIIGLIQSEQDIEDYKVICDMVCQDLRQKVDEYTEQAEG